MALHLAYVLLLQAGYRNGDLSLVYPMARATGPLLSTTFAVFFLGETVTAQMGLGAGVIICGVLFLTGGFRPRAAIIGHWREHFAPRPGPAGALNRRRFAPQNPKKTRAGRHPA